MQLDPSTLEGARKLVQRLQRFIDALERVKRQPNRREAYHALVVVECLRDGRHEQGEEAMLKVERVSPLPPGAALQSGPYDTTTTRQLRDLLENIEIGR
jgi:hypothetical protein